MLWVTRVQPHISTIEPRKVNSNAKLRPRNNTFARLSQAIYGVKRVCASLFILRLGKTVHKIVCTGWHTHVSRRK